MSALPEHPVQTLKRQALEAHATGDRGTYLAIEARLGRLVNFVRSPVLDGHLGARPEEIKPVRRFDERLRTLPTSQDLWTHARGALTACCELCWSPEGEFVRAEVMTERHRAYYHDVVGVWLPMVQTNLGIPAREPRLPHPVEIAHHLGLSLISEAGLYAE